MKALHVIAVSALLSSLLGGAGLWGRARYERAIPHGDEAARGVRIGGEVVPDGTTPSAFARAKADQMLDRPLELRFEGVTVLSSTPRALGATVDVAWATARALEIARTGDPYDRWVEAKAASEGAFDVALPLRVPSGALSEKLYDVKEELDEPPVAARRHLDTGEIEPHVTGRYLDVDAAANAVLAAMQKGGPRVDLEPFLIVPNATAERARDVDISVTVSSFETHFGGPPGRDQNILRASSLLDGVVLLPGDELSFNALVGARSIENGFAYAPEIYKGEMREGVGGGACQVASTLHAAAFFGGLDILQRQNHSRPSAYVRPGLDATVSFPVLDLRIRNPFDFPVLVHSKIDKGTLRFEILGHDQPVTVELATETAGVFKYTRKIEKVAGLTDMRVKQRGKNGMAIRRTKTVRKKAGESQVSVSKDTYPATQEILQIPPDFDVTTLPPLPSEAPAGDGGGTPSG